jgi:REP element-mobilizing transposase RayT
MPRANRSYLPGLIWHVTHRCHKKEYLLKFHRDKMLWIRWMHEAKLRFGLTVLNFMITSNHIHLMALAGRAEAAGTSRPISRTIQLAHSRLAQEYNLRKERHGAYWEDRFHATAIETGTQFAKCLTYVDMNMVRAAVVGHPRDWEFCGYREMVRPDIRPRLRLVDENVLAGLIGARDHRSLARMRDAWIEEAIRKGQLEREPLWTESVAVGGEDFLKRVSGDLGGRIGGVGGGVLQPKRLITEEIGHMGIFRDSEGDRIVIHSRK